MAPVTTIRILMIDDDRDDRHLVIDMLKESKRARFVVDEAESGEKGMLALQNGHYDVVFLDYRLPDKDGLAVLKDIIDLRFSVPVTIITNMNDISLQSRALEAGAVDFLEKGKFNTDILERTCMYAIGMHEKKTKNGSGPGVGVLMEQLVNLTRDGIKAQTEMTQETREFRRELGTGLKSISTQLQQHSTECTNGHNVVLAKLDITKAPKYKWILDWIGTHPLITLALVVCVLALVAVTASLGVILFEHLGADQIKAVKGIPETTSYLKNEAEVFQQWIG